MYCPYCGKGISDGAKFCPLCGKALNQADEGAPKHISPANAPNTGAEQSGTSSGTATQAKSKRPLNKKLLGGAAVVLAACIAIGAVAGVVSRGGKGDGNQYACAWLEDGELYYYRDVRKQSIGVPIAELDSYYGSSGDTDNDSWFCARFSPDGEYLYFFRDFSDADSPATLCRIELKKVGSNREQNEALVEEIEESVSPLSLTFDADGKLEFRRYQEYSDQVYDLCSYDGEKVETQLSGINESVSSDNVVYYLEEESGEDTYRLSVLSGDGRDGNAKVADGVNWLYSSVNGDAVYTVNEGESELTTLFIAHPDGKSETLAEHVAYYNLYSSNSKGFYYATQESKDVRASDYVTNSQAASDAKQEAPDYFDDNYSSAYDAYSQAQNRIKAMEYFKDATITLKENTLYYYDWEKGSSSSIADNLSPSNDLWGNEVTDGKSSLIWYFKGADEKKVLEVQDVLDYSGSSWYYNTDTLNYDLETLLSENDNTTHSELYYSLDGGAEQRLDLSALAMEKPVTDMQFALYGDASSIAMMGMSDPDDTSEEDYDEEEDLIYSDVYTASISDGKIGSAKRLDLSDVTSISSRYDQLYCECQEDGYLVQDGKPVLAKVGDGKWLCNEDGSILSIWEGAAYGSELMLTKKDGKPVSIDKGVSDCKSLDEGALLFLKQDGDLIYSNGKKGKQIAANASVFWCAQGMSLTTW